ncbi:MAG TPA: hypothetical protein VLD40_03885, partial [Dissulfurispiraceae bacterium]|nr:hypothetical protein [Dissulfurispiraceae bacterium]
LSEAPERDKAAARLEKTKSSKQRLQRLPLFLPGMTLDWYFIRAMSGRMSTVEIVKKAPRGTDCRGKGAKWYR